MSTDPNDPKAIAARSLAGAIRCANAASPPIIHEPDGVYDRAVRAWSGELARYHYDVQRDRLSRIADA